MSTVKLAVIYYSATGNNYRLAEWAAEGAREAGAEATVYKVQELVPASIIEANPAMKAHADATRNIPIATPDVIVDADAIIFSSPSRFGNIAAQLKQFLDTTGGIWAQGKTANKVVSAMSSGQNDHGGQEMTILSLYTSMYHWGAIIVGPGYTDQSLFAAGGNPYGTSASIDQNNNMRSDPEAIRTAVKYQAKRVVTIASWVKRGLNG